MIIPVYQPLASSSHKLAQKIGALYNTKATHTGTLDPMAEGVLVCLTGQDRFLKGTLNWKKTYVVDIAVGFKTDSLDLLGVIEKKVKIEKNKLNLENEISTFVNKSIGKYKQRIPVFSAKRLGGSSSFDIAKKKLAKIPTSTEEITIHKAKYLTQKQVNSKTFFETYIRTIENIEGDFRQQEILEQWQKIFATDTDIPIITMEFTVSKRTYIRSLVNDLGKALDLPVCVARITRTQNGPYTIADCICLT